MLEQSTGKLLTVRVPSDDKESQSEKGEPKKRAEIINQKSLQQSQIIGQVKKPNLRIRRRSQKRKSNQ